MSILNAGVKGISTKRLREIQQRDHACKSPKELEGRKKVAAATRKLVEDCPWN